MPNRGNGEGTITRRKDGRWEIAVIDPATGKRHRAYAKTLAEARASLREMVNRAELGHPVIDAAATIATYAEAWLGDRAGRRRREATVREYAWRLRKHVLPVIGGLRLKELHVHHVEDLLDLLMKGGLSRSTVKAIRNSLAAMLSDAVRARHLSVNVAKAAQLPEYGPATAQKMRVPTSAQVHALLLASRGTEIECLLLVLAGTGARIGEALAMRWSDLDLEEAIWTVSRTTTRNLTGSVVLGERTKTGESRLVPLPEEVIQGLRAQRRAVATAQVASPLWRDHDLVFPTSIGTPQDPRNVRKPLRPIATAAGFPGSFHGLRHHYASVAVAMAPDVIVSKILGHARTSTTTDLYAHLRSEDAHKIAVAVSVAVNGSK